MADSKVNLLLVENYSRQPTDAETILDLVCHRQGLVREKK